jgi:hypothetical protein
LKSILLEVGESESEDGTQLLFEIMVGRAPQGDSSIPTNLPCSISRRIESGLSPGSGKSYSFNNILEILRHSNSEIDDDVDSAEVFAFVRCLASAERSEK